MIISSRSLRTLDAGSGIALLLAAALYFWPVHIAVPVAGPFAGSTTLSSAPASNADDNELATVVASNILSGSRRAPSVRYMSPELMPAVDYSMPAAFAGAVPSDSATVAADELDAVPSLYGIVNSDGTWRALLRLSDSDVSPALLREGDRRGSYRVVSIRPNAVVVAGPSGQRTLRLTRGSRNDSTGKFQ